MAAVKKAEDFRLEENRFQLAEHARNHWVVSVDHDVTVMDMLIPGYWANVGKKLRPWDIIEARADDGSWFAMFVVLGAERTHAKVAVVLEAKLTTADVALTQNVQDSGVPGYSYQWKGAKLRHCIVRHADGAVVHSDAHTKADALHWLNERKVELTA